MFDLDTTEKNSEIVILPVPWEKTVTYGTGTSKAPRQIEAESAQLDLYHMDGADVWKKGICMTEDVPYEDVYEKTLFWLDKGKYVCILGGEHSVSFPAIHAFTRHFGDIGVLQLDAHMDLRKAYLGVPESHASVMYNVLKLEHITHVTQVGIRDFCDEEYQRAKTDSRVTTFFDHWITEQLFEGNNWGALCREIVSTLPEYIYITCDIDGLNPVYCPNTGTPVPGGLSFNQWVYLLKEILYSGRKIVGIDLMEVSCGQSRSVWDANVGARILYQMIVYGVQSMVLAAE